MCCTSIVNSSFKNHTAKDFLDYAGSVVFKKHEDTEELELFCISDDEYQAHGPRGYREWLASNFDIHF